ncbi:MAG: ABC transporter permease, partial [Planctomycetales bacterium]|nr:ABC transporter permease [Planctomycetales bacterium]
QIPGIESIDTMRFTKGNVQDGESAFLIDRDFPTVANVNFDVASGRTPAELRQALLDGQVIIGSVLAQRTGLHAGDMLSIETRDGPRELPIAAVANEYMSGGLAVHLHRNVAQQMLELDGVDVYIIKTEPQARAEVGRRLRTICEDEGLMLQSYADLINMVDGMMGGLVASLWGLLVMGFIVAAFGMVNTLTMNVLEQSRELGQLRIVGTTRRQVRRTIFAQAIIMGLLAIVPGVGIGVLLAWLINISTMPVTGHPIEFVLRPGLIAGATAVAFVVILISAWLPAERATRLKLASALRYE